MSMSISEIAKYLKVSKSTVSLVINGKAEQGRISKELAQRVKDYVEQIGYKPNALAKGLATGKSNSIGLIVENIGDSFFGPIALYIEEYLREHGYHVFYSSTLGDESLAADMIETMMEKKVEGMILAPTLKVEESVSTLVEKGIPIVVFDRKINGVDTHYVGTNNYDASAEAVRHLLGNGYGRIGMVTIDSEQSQMNDRLLAYLEVLEKENLTASVLTLPYSSYKREAVFDIAKWLQNEPNLDGLYFSTNYLCLAGLKAIKKLSKPKLYGIITFDDHEVFELLEPSVSCVEQPLKEIASAVVNMLLRQLEGARTPIMEEIIPSKLIIRKSSQ